MKSLMESLANFFELDNTLVSYILGIVIMVVSLAVSILCIINKKNGTKADKPMAITYTVVSLLLVAIANVCAYHFILTIACITAVIAAAFSLARLNLAVNTDRCYDVSLYSLFARIIMPLSILGLLNGPLFIDTAFYGESVTSYKIWSLFGMKTVGIYAFSFDHFNLLALIGLLLFAALIIIQIYTIVRLFINPDYCEDWSLFHLILTSVGVLFVNGIYTSDNFNLLDIMPSVDSSLSPTYVIYFIIILAVLNKIVYFKKVHTWLNKISK